MKNNDKQIIRLAEEKVVELYDSGSDHNLVYHTIDHTRNVVKRVNEIDVARWPYIADCLDGKKSRCKIWPTMVNSAPSSTTASGKAWIPFVTKWSWKNTGPLERHHGSCGPSDP